MMINRRKLLTGAAALATYGQFAQGQSITPQIGGGIGSAFDGGVSGVKTGVNWLAEGDSITIGLGGTPAYPFVALQSMPGGGSFAWNNFNNDAFATITGVGRVHCNDIGTSGITAATINFNFATRAGAAFDANKALNVFSIMAGTNDSSGSTALAIYLLLRSILRKATAAGYQRKVIGTITARDDDGGTRWTNVLIPLNTLIRTYYNNDLDCDALMDFGNNANFGSTAAADNLAFYISDKLHPNVAGEAAMGAIAEPGVLAALLAGSKAPFPATWSTIDILSLYVLSNSNRTVTIGSSASNGAAISFDKRTSGKWYGEILANTAFDCMYGLANDNQPGSGLSLNNTTTAVGWGFDFSGNNTVKYNGTLLATISTISDGDLIQIAVDIDNKRFWIRKSTGNWNGNASANPATGVGGLDISALIANDPHIHFATTLFTSGPPAGSATSNFAAAQMTGPIPAGFGTFA